MYKRQIAHTERNGEVIDVSVNQLRPDEIFIVRPGEGIPVDGCLLYTSDAADEALFLARASSNFPSKTSVINTALASK